MPTDVDTDRGGQLAGPGASVRFAVVSRSVPSSKVKSPCRLQFRQAEARCEPRCVIAPSAFSHTRQSHHSLASKGYARRPAGRRRAAEPASR